MDENQHKKRVIAYVDGFNLYYGLCDSKFRRYLWLNVRTLAERLLRPDQELVEAKYFTARISGGRPADRPDYAANRNAKRSRQTTYLDALGTVPNLTVIYGNFLEKEARCNKCGAKWMQAEEKMTDVNIATEMMVDAFQDKFDVALLISGDSDLSPPLAAIHCLMPYKRLNVAMPPSRSSVMLKKTADGECIIGRATLKKSQFPEIVVTSSGRTLTRPTEWT